MKSSKVLVFTTSISVTSQSQVLGIWAKNFNSFSIFILPSIGNPWTPTSTPSLDRADPRLWSLNEIIPPRVPIWFNNRLLAGLPPWTSNSSIRPSSNNHVETVVVALCLRQSFHFGSIISWVPSIPRSHWIVSLFPLVALFSIIPVASLLTRLDRNAGRLVVAVDEDDTLDDVALCYITFLTIWRCKK